MNALSSRLDIDSLGSWGVEWSIISIAGVSWSIDNQYGELRGRGGKQPTVVAGLVLEKILRVIVFLLIAAGGIVV